MLRVWMLEQPAHKSEDPPRSERRRSVRICCTGFAEGLSSNPNQLFRGEIRNVSETGCFISVRAPVSLPPGTCVELRFRIGHADYAALAHVVEAMPFHGVRMRFIATDPAFIERIHQILRATADSP